ncbi:dienelactone hydrolase family-domain-containing protein [Chytriomyces sp. MP71]|nr:dienelactone hydrolase family-domain-containing protein [Chytriomyces sp. MP71]
MASMKFQPVLSLVSRVGRGPMRGLSSRTLDESTIVPGSLPLGSRVVAPDPRAVAAHSLHGSTAERTLRPAIVVLQEWWGVNPAVLAHAQRVANITGAIAIVPDMYNGKATSDAEEAKRLMDNLDWPKALGDLKNLIRILQTPADAPMGLYKDRKVGTLGFCMGGALSLAAAAKMAEVKKPLNACVSFYGTPSPKLIDISNIPAMTPVQAHFGEKDEYFGFSDIKTAKKLAEMWDLTIKNLGGAHAHGFHSLESNVYVHEGLGHAFMNEDGSKPHVVGGEVDKAWERVAKFFVEHLKTV